MNDPSGSVSRAVERPGKSSSDSLRSSGCNEFVSRLQQPLCRKEGTERGVLSSGYCDAHYRKAQRVRRLIRDDCVTAFGNLDVFLLPTVPRPPFKLGEFLDRPLKLYISDISTVFPSLAGLPVGF